MISNVQYDLFWVLKMNTSVRSIILYERWDHKTTLKIDESQRINRYKGKKTLNACDRPTKIVKFVIRRCTHSDRTLLLLRSRSPPTRFLERRSRRGPRTAARTGRPRTASTALWTSLSWLWTSQDRKRQICCCYDGARSAEWKNALSTRRTWRIAVN